MTCSENKIPPKKRPFKLDDLHISLITLQYYKRIINKPITFYDFIKIICLFHPI